MAKGSRGKGGRRRVTAKSRMTGRVSRSAATGRFVTAAPVRTKAASARLAATLESLGADPKVVEAAGRD